MFTGKSLAPAYKYTCSRKQKYNEQISPIVSYELL